jgi:uncharacterized damage-inducible protein DinB
MYTTRPDPEEYADAYAGYISTVPDGDIRDRLVEQAHATQVLLRGLSDEVARTPYAPGKWCIKEVLGHLIDAERIFCTRALRFARNDRTELPGYDHDAYVAVARFEDRKLSSLLREFAAVREATLRLFESFRPEDFERGGVANGRHTTVRAIAWIIAGHERHHQRGLRERYLAGGMGDGK